MASLKTAGRSAGRRWDRTLTVLLAMAVTAAVVATGYVAAQPKTGDRFTEFYILGPAAKAAGYPRIMRPGEGEDVMVGIANREQKTASYSIIATLDGERVAATPPVVLAHHERWEGPVTITPRTGGGDQKVQLFLFKDGGAEPYLGPLRLWIEVVQ